MPLVLEVGGHVFAAERLHGDDTTVPVLAKEQTKTGRVWGYVRDDRPFGGPDPPAVAFFYSPDRSGAHPERHLAGFAGILQATPMPGSTGSMSRTVSRGRSSRPHVGHTRVANCLSSRRSARRRSRARRCGGSTSCSSSSARSTGSRPSSAWRCVRNGRSRCRRAGGLAARSVRAGLAQVGDRQGARLCPQPLDRAHPLPGGRADLLEQQRRRAGAAWYCHRSKELDVRRQ